MNSHLLEGIVRHRRVRPFVYALEHDVFYVALDLDELDEVPRQAPVDQPRTAGTCCRSATTTTSTRPPATSARPSSTTCAAKAWTRTAGRSRS